MPMDSKTSGAVGGAAQGATIGAQFGGVYGAAAGAVIGGAMGFMSGGGEDQAMKIAELQANIIRQTAVENNRRMEVSRQQQLGKGRAAIGASGIINSGSARNYLNVMDREIKSDMSWRMNKARMEANLALEGGQAAADQIQTAGMSNMMSGLTSAASAGTFGSYTKSGGYEPPTWMK